MFPTDVVIVAGARTPMARYTGAFSEVSAIELAALASKEAIRRSNVDPGEFDHAIFWQRDADERGCTLWGAACGIESGAEGRNACGDGEPAVRVRD